VRYVEVNPGMFKFSRGGVTRRAPLVVVSYGDTRENVTRIAKDAETTER
jgi:hypothetical protein